MSLSLLAIHSFALVAVLLGPGMDPSSPGSGQSGPRSTPLTRRSPFEARTAQEPADPIERAVSRAKRFKAESEYLGATEAGFAYLDMCDDLLRRIAGLKADHYPALMLSGESCYLRATLVTDPARRLALIETGLGHFEQAERCENLEWQLYETWGQGLTMLAYLRIRDPETKIRLLNRAVDILERGAEREELGDDRRNLLVSAGLASTMLAEIQADRTGQTLWYRQAVRRYDEAERFGIEINTIHEAVWIEALFNLGHLTGNRAHAERAVERSKRLLAADPEFLNTHYNLACAYAVLGKHYLAVEHLQRCVERDKSYYKKIREDRVLAELRDSGEYAAFLESVGAAK